MKYRDDITGLRAIAVLSVIAAHVGMAWMPGGFLGVDVFFVISGYLISGIIYADIKAGSFSIAGFYERRVRRIIPALVVMLAGASILASIYLFPVEMKDYGKSVVATVCAVSNIFFWSQAGYFDNPSLQKPLLHTWSLAVEEQFYVFFPVLLLLAYRHFRPRLKSFIAFLFIVSFIASVFGDFYYQDARFYLTTNRAWELLLGSMVALEILPSIRGKLLQNAASAAGLALILYSFVAVGQFTPYLGMWSMLPCAGAALIIAAGVSGSSIVGRGLSMKPVTFIGLISYSLYLWHWPVIVFHHMEFMPYHPASAKMEKGMLVVLSLALGTLSWRYVETPFRNRKFMRRDLFKLTFASLGVLAIFGGSLVLADGLPSRFSSDVNRMSAYLNDRHDDVTRVGKCFLSTNHSFDEFDRSACMKFSETKKNYLLMGDSHAAHLWSGLSEAFPDINIMQATSAGCLPVVSHPAGMYATCVSLTDYVYKDFLPNHKVDGLIIEAAWTETDFFTVAPLMDYLKGISNNIIFFGPIVRYDGPLPKILAIGMLNGDADYASRRREEKYRELDKKMGQLAQEKSIRYVSFFDMLCSGPKCLTTTSAGVPLLYDYGHLTPEGSLYVGEYIRDKGILGGPDVK